MSAKECLSEREGVSEGGRDGGRKKEMLVFTSSKCLSTASPSSARLAKELQR